MITVGDILKKERIKKNFTLEDIEKITKIRKKNLIALEAGDWKKFPSKMYIVGIINTYSQFLSLDSQKLNAFFRREYERKEEINFKTGVDKSKVTPQKKRNFRLLITAVTFVFLCYFGYQVKQYLTPPRVEILEPTRKEFVIEDKVELKGVTQKEVIVFVNGERVYLDKNNIFRTYISLSKAQNKVTIEATGANGRKTVLTREYLKKTK